MRSCRSGAKNPACACCARPVRQLHHDDADVVHHRQQHLADVFRLARLRSQKSSRLILVTPSTSAPVRGRISSAIPLRYLRVLHHVVQQRGAERSSRPSFMSASTCATSRGCERKGSPDSRYCARCCSAAKSNARRNSSTSSEGRFWRSFAVSSANRASIVRADRSKRRRDLPGGAMLYFTSPEG